jgi:hypothetical protein
LKAANIECFADLSDQAGLLVNDRDVVILARQMLSDAGAHLAGAADHHFHAAVSAGLGRPLPLSNAQRFELAMQGRTLHADETRRAGDIAAKPIDLC